LALTLRDGCENNLSAWLDAQLFKWLGHVGQQTEVGVLHWLASTAHDSVCVVDLQVLDHSVIIHGKLGPLYVILHFRAKLLEIPHGIEVDFELNLLGTWIPHLLARCCILLILAHVALEVLVLDLDSDEQLDATLVSSVVPWHKWRGRVGG